MPDSVSKEAVEDLVRQVLKEIDNNHSQTDAPAIPQSVPVAPQVLPDAPTSSTTADGVCLFANLDQAVEAARLSQRRFIDLTMEKRNEIIANIRSHALANADRLGQLAVTETALGRMPDKMNKIILCARKTPGPEDLRPEAFTGDYGLTLVEPAPWGVLGSVTPSTNPVSTVLNNSISILSAGNSVVFNPHPAAKNVSAEMAKLVHDAVVEAGGPENLVTMISTPSINRPMP